MDDSKPCQWCDNTSGTTDSQEAHIEELMLEVKNLRWLMTSLVDGSTKTRLANISMRSANIKMAMEVAKHINK